jgi:hypothetical protein
MSSNNWLLKMDTINMPLGKNYFVTCHDLRASKMDDKNFNTYIINFGLKYILLVGANPFGCHQNGVIIII